MSENEKEYLEIIKDSIEYKVHGFGWENKEISLWLEGILFAISNCYSDEFINAVYKLRGQYLELED